VACDSQLNVTSSEDFAKFWLRFLGCAFIVEPRVATQRFFESSVKFINDNVTDPVLKSEFYDALQAELRSAKRTFSPKQFIEEYVHSDYQNAFREHLVEQHVSLTAFQKDTVDIARKLKRRAYETTKGAMISIPEEDADLVVVNEEQIIVNDSVVRVK